jgi:hypothetical protein
MLVGWSIRPSVGPHSEILRRGEGKGREMMSKTGYVKIASRLVTVTRSCLFIQNFLFYVLRPYFQTAITSKQLIEKSPSWSHSLHLIEFFPDLTHFLDFIHRDNIKVVLFS